MTQYVLLSPTDTIEKSSTQDGVLSVGTKAGWRWLPVVKSSVDNSTDANYTVSETVQTITPTEVQRVSTKRDMTGAEKLAKVKQEATGADRILITILFDMANQIRTNNGQGTITKPQFLNYIEGLLL